MLQKFLEILLRKRSRVRTVHEVVEHLMLGKVMKRLASIPCNLGHHCDDGIIRESFIALAGRDFPLASIFARSMHFPRRSKVKVYPLILPLLLAKRSGMRRALLYLIRIEAKSNLPT